MHSENYVQEVDVEMPGMGNWGWIDLPVEVPLPISQINATVNTASKFKKGDTSL